MERDQLQQQVRRLQDAVNERDRLQEELADIKEERDSFKERAMELERRLKAASGPDKVMQAKESEPETQIDDEGTQTDGLGPETDVPSPSEAPKKLRYCNMCLKSVDKSSANVRLYPAKQRSVLISATGQNQACRKMRDKRIGIFTFNPRRSESREAEAK